MLIECKNVTKTYVADHKKITAVDEVNLSIAKGDFAVILGHSGSGKTTLLSLIGGLAKPDKGEIIINGVSNWQQSDRDISRLRNSTIGFVFQFASLIPTLTVIENMLLPMSFGKRITGGRKTAAQILDQVGLADKANSFPSQLSGGQQRRVAISRAFINQPEIILADEPTGDLDEETEGEVLSLFKEYNSQGTTFIVVTHNSDFGKSQNSPRIMNMKNGVLSED